MMRKRHERPPRPLLWRRMRPAKVLTGQVDELTAELDTVRAGNEQLSGELAELGTANAALLIRVGTAEARVDELTVELSQARERLAEQKAGAAAAAARAAAHLEAAQHEVGRLRNELGVMTARAGDAERELPAEQARRTAELGAAQAENERLARELEAARNELAQARLTITDHAVTISELRARAGSEESGE